MSTSSVTGSTSTSNAASALNQVTGTSSKDQETKFLNLLVTQLKNQDPLNPMDNAQMTTQLAQISTVSGIEKLNTTLQSLLTGYNNTQNMQAASLIGHAVLSTGNDLTLGTSGAVGGLTLDKAADTVKISVKDANGNIVQTVDLGAQAAGTSNFVWDGKDSNGNAMAAGDYTFSVEAKASGAAVTATALQAGMVSAVSLNSDGMKLELGSGKQVNYSDIKQIL